MAKRLIGWKDFIVGGFSFYTAIEKIWCVMVTNLFAVREEADGRRKAA